MKYNYIIEICIRFFLFSSDTYHFKGQIFKPISMMES